MRLEIYASVLSLREREREMFYLTTHSTHFIYGYMASDIWLRTILIVRKETRCRHIGYSYRLTARVLLYAPSHRQDNTYHGLCYTSRGALAGTRNSSMGPPHDSLREYILQANVCVTIDWSIWSPRSKKQGLLRDLLTDMIAIVYVSNFRPKTERMLKASRSVYISKNVGGWLDYWLNNQTLLQGILYCFRTSVKYDKRLSYTCNLIWFCSVWIPQGGGGCNGCWTDCLTEFAGK